MPRPKRYNSRSEYPSCQKSVRRRQSAKYREKNRQLLRDKAIRYYREHPEQRLNYLYGLTCTEYKSLLEKQKGGCAICGTPPNSRGLAVDHDHNSSRVRGLLCDKCNRGLGHFNAETIQIAASYLLASA